MKEINKQEKKSGRERERRGWLLKVLFCCWAGTASTWEEGCSGIWRVVDGVGSSIGHARLLLLLFFLDINLLLIFANVDNYGKAARCCWISARTTVWGGFCLVTLPILFELQCFCISHSYISLFLSVFSPLSLISLLSVACVLSRMFR